MTDFNPQSLGKELKKLREAAGFTQDELADKAEISYSSLAKMEQGKVNNPSFFTILTLSQLLGVTLDQLVGLVPKTPQTGSGGTKQAISTIVFDIHGVLVCNWEHIFVKIAQIAGADTHQVEERFWVYDDAVAEGVMSIAEFERALAADLNFDVRHFRYRDVYLQSVEPFQPAHDLLRELKHTYDIVLMSNIFPGFADALFRQGALPYSREAYRSLFLSCEVQAVKPRSVMYQIAERELNKPPSSLLFIDDFPNNIAAATSRGWHGVVYEQEDWQASHEQIRQLLN